MNTFIEMSPAARAYWFCIIAAGSFCFLFSVAGWPGQHDSALAITIYAITAIVASGLKFRLPGILGTLSLNYIVIIAALLNLSLASGMIVAVVSTFGQCIIHAANRPRWFQVLFSTAGVPVPVLAASFTLHLPLFSQIDPTGCIVLLVASSVYFTLTTTMVAGIICLTNGKGFLDVWRTSYLWTSLHYLVGGSIAGAIHFVSRYVGWPALAVAIPPLYLLYRSYRVYLMRIEEQQTHITEMAQLHLRTIETLALAIDAKDDTTAAHLRRVQIYAAEVGKELKLSAPEMQALEAAALLHDVGKLAVPEYIISKPGKLTPDEFEKMKVHPVVGAEILERVHFPYPVVPIVRSHHEKYDGTGYPDGLSGEQIPIGARILSAIDCLDALASDRQYRKALPLEEAMAYLTKESGKSYDPVIVGILQRRFQELESKAKAETADCAKLSSNVRVERGLAPAAGFAEAALPAVSAAPENFSKAISRARGEFHLIEAMNDLGKLLSVEETLAVLAVRLNRIVAHDAIAIWLIDGRKLVPRFVKGESFRLFSSLEIPMGQGLSGWVAENDQPIINGNPAVEPGYLNDPSKVTPLRSALGVPLRSGDRIVGVLTLYRMQADAFTTDDRRLLLAVAPKAGLSIENSLRFERAAAAAETDELTGLPNARFLLSHLQKEIENAAHRPGPLAVVLMDLDGFKAVNDRHGHLAGNRLLQAVARDLRRNCRATDVLARLGGDEFVLVISDPEFNLQESLARIDQVIRGISVEARGETCISVSAGVATFPEDGTDAEALLEKADKRMYETKRRRQLFRVA